MLATVIAIIDVIFILLFVPESLPEKLRLSSVSLWEQADPFSSLKKVGKDQMILMLCIAVFLSYLPEAGQYSCFFVYLRLVIGFSAEEVALFIAVVGLLSVIAQVGMALMNFSNINFNLQTAVLTMLMKSVGSKNTIMIGLLFEMLQLMWYGFGSQSWMMWTAGFIASISSITYPAISAYVSTYADADKQGLVQGMITGMRGLCNGLGPAVYGFIFNLFHVDLTHSLVPEMTTMKTDGHSLLSNATPPHLLHFPDNQFVPGPPFVFGAFLVLLAILVTAFIPEFIQYHQQTGSSLGSTSSKFSKSPTHRDRSTSYYYTNVQYQRSDTQCIGVNANDDKESGSEDFDNKIDKISNKSTGSPKRQNSTRYEMHKRGSNIVNNVDLQVPLMMQVDNETL